MFIFKTTNIHKLLILYVLVLFMSHPSCGQMKSIAITKYAQSNDGMVVSAHPLASNVGVDILKNGRKRSGCCNCSAVCFGCGVSGAGNIGGGGFMVIQSQKEFLIALITGKKHL